MPEAEVDGLRSLASLGALGLMIEGESVGLPGRLGAGVLAPEFHTPSTSTPFSSARTPKGTSFARPLLTLAECCIARLRARVSSLIFAYLRRRQVLYVNLQRPRVTTMTYTDQFVNEW